MTRIVLCSVETRESYETSYPTLRRLMEESRMILIGRYRAGIIDAKMHYQQTVFHPLGRPLLEYRPTTPNFLQY